MLYVEFRQATKTREIGGRALGDSVKNSMRKKAKVRWLLVVNYFVVHSHPHEILTVLSKALRK